MKKRIIAFTAIFSLAVLFSGCGNQSEEAPDELDILTGILQTTHLNDEAPETEEETESESKGTEYKSVTGVLVSFSENSITINDDSEDRTFLIDEKTQFFGVKPDSSTAITITYEESDENENITAVIVTVFGSDDGAVSDDEATASETDLSDTAEETMEPEEVADESSADGEPDETTSQTLLSEETSQTEQTEDSQDI